MAKKKKTKRTLKPVADPSAAGKNKRMPRKPWYWWGMKSESIYHE